MKHCGMYQFAKSTADAYENQYAFYGQISNIL